MKDWKMYNNRVNGKLVKANERKSISLKAENESEQKEKQKNKQQKQAGKRANNWLKC